MFCLYRLFFLLVFFTYKCYAGLSKDDKIVTEIAGEDIKRPTKEIDENALMFLESVRKCNGSGGILSFLLKKILFLTFGPYLIYVYNKLYRRSLSVFDNDDYTRNQKIINDYNRRYVLRDFISDFIKGKQYDDLTYRLIKEKEKYLKGPQERPSDVDETGLSLILLEWLNGENASLDDICKELSEVPKKNLSKLFNAIKSIMGTTEDSFLNFFSPEVLLPIKYGIENYVLCDAEGKCKVEYPFSLPEEIKQYEISKERARMIIIGNIVSVLLFIFIVCCFLPRAGTFRIVYLLIQCLSLLYFYGVCCENKSSFLCCLVVVFSYFMAEYSPGSTEFFSLLCLIFTFPLILHMLFYLNESIIFIFFALTGFPEEIETFLSIGHRDSIVRDYIKKTWKIYKKIKANDVLKRAFKNEIKELDSVFGSCENIDFNKEVNLSQYDMERNAMLERSCKLLTHRYFSEKPLSLTAVDLRKYMDFDKDFSTLVKTCKRDIIKMFVVGKKLSAYLSIFLRKEGNNKK